MGTGTRSRKREKGEGEDDEDKVAREAEEEVVLAVEEVAHKVQLAQLTAGDVGEVVVQLLSVLFFAQGTMAMTEATLQIICSQPIAILAFIFLLVINQPVK